MYYFIIKETESGPMFLGDYTITNEPWTQTEGCQARFFTRTYANRICSRYSGKVIDSSEAPAIWELIKNKNK